MNAEQSVGRDHLEDFEVNEELTLYGPDSDGNIEIEFNTYESIMSKYVKFSELEKWVSLVRRQIIDKALEQ